MKFRLFKIQHLGRYFRLLGIVVFFGYVRHWDDRVFLALMGPFLYLAGGMRELLVNLLPIPSTKEINEYGFLLPLAILYFSLLGFLFKHLWNERGKARTLSLIALTAFLLFIHYRAWQLLSLYFVPI